MVRLFVWQNLSVLPVTNVIALHIYYYPGMPDTGDNYLGSS